MLWQMSHTIPAMPYMVLHLAHAAAGGNGPYVALVIEV